MPKHASTAPLDKDARIYEPGRYWHNIRHRIRRESYNLPRPAHSTPATSENQETSG